LQIDTGDGAIMAVLAVRDRSPDEAQRKPGGPSVMNLG
jgi:hypothetical protein